MKKNVYSTENQFSFEVDQFYLKYKCCVSGDDRRESLLPVSVIRSANQFTDLTLGHLGEPFLPTADDLACTKHKLKGLVPVTTAIEFGTVFQSPCVVHYHVVTPLREVLTIS